MCEMEVRAGQRNSTIAQACAHNTNTIIGDLDMFAAVLRARGHGDAATECDTVKGDLARSYVMLRDMFGAFAATEPHAQDEPVGNERASALKLAQNMDAAIKRARRFETR